MSRLPSIQVVAIRLDNTRERPRSLSPVDALELVFALYGYIAMDATTVIHKGRGTFEVIITPNGAERSLVYRLTRFVLDDATSRNIFGAINKPSRTHYRPIDIVRSTLLNLRKITSDEAKLLHDAALSTRQWAEVLVAVTYSDSSLKRALDSR